MTRQQRGSSTDAAQMMQSDGGGNVTVGPVMVRSKQPAAVTLSRSSKTIRMYLSITLGLA
jgi:hypothetical protein